MQVQVVSKANWNSYLLKEYSEKIGLNENSVVLVDVNVEDIEKIEYLNNQVIITLKNGEKIIIENFNAEESSLVFRNEQSELFLFDFETLDYNPIEALLHKDLKIRFTLSDSGLSDNLGMRSA